MMTEMTKKWAIEKVESYGLNSDYVDVVYLATILLKHERRGELITALRSNMLSLEGEVQFLRSHLKDIVSDIMTEKNYTPKFPETKIDDIWSELGLWHEAIEERENNEINHEAV